MQFKTSFFALLAGFLASSTLAAYVPVADSVPDNDSLTAPDCTHDGSTTTTAPAGDAVVPVPAEPDSEVRLNATQVLASLDAGGKVATAWYPSWQAAAHPPESLSWDKYNAMTFAFATTTSDPANPLALDAESQALLPKFVEQAKQHNVKALLSLGGWTGSIYFSDHVSTPERRTAFVKAVVDLATQYNLDGIDFDWEFPNKQGIGCNHISNADSANFLAFLQELRQDPTGGKLMLTAAVGLLPFVGSDGQPMSDVSGFAEVFDFIAIMAYDVWGAWSPTVGPNAPLQDSCAANGVGSVASSVAAWTGAGFPANKLVLGVPAYGRSYYVDPANALSAAGELTPYAQFDKSKQPLGEGETGEQTVDQCGVASGPSGLFNFAGLVDAGYLNPDGTAAEGMVYLCDQCSETPFVYQKDTGTMITYDDAESTAAKGNFIAEQGLKGFAIWHGIGDYNDILLDAVSRGMGQ
ncbi:endochitinase [Coprinopsis cinerea okayama7|uniref:Endochitinase n=1 Tax=Coprinopsis cinerea (strain Okayama-7 / 130 / ATCC MYA-4618 / FGSC 9003) TaxID=240176 RepID=A8PCI2_COPC7|nr:endochitinase [Coprinopsis cinerea okayama7\|eukprot:XP_001840405.1 endochitinase [Coprinopsis cinerea okayama7\